MIANIPMLIRRCQIPPASVSPLARLAGVIWLLRNHPLRLGRYYLPLLFSVIAYLAPGATGALWTAGLRGEARARGSRLN